MIRSVRDVLIIREHHNMIAALSTNDLNIVAFNFENENSISPTSKSMENLASTPREFRNRTLIDNLLDIVALFRTIKSVHPDIVHVNALQDLVSTFIAVKILSAFGTKPAIIAMSRNPNSWKNSKKAWFYAKIIQFFSDGFIAMSTMHKDQLLQLSVPSTKLTVIPNPYDPKQVEIYPALSQKKADQYLRITYVANICERKAQDVLINAASGVIKKHSQVKFELIGKVVQGEEDYSEKLRSMIRDYRLEDSIYLTGRIPYKDVLASLLQCDIFVFPTYSEIMPRAVIEAMVFGLPVIASAVDGILDLIQDGKTGILVQPGNSSDLECAICELIENPDLASTIGSAGQKHVMEFCSPERVGKQLHEFYTYILNKKIAGD